jgi:hypothetical protein
MKRLPTPGKSHPRRIRVSLGSGTQMHLPAYPANPQTPTCRDDPSTTYLPTPGLGYPILSYLHPKTNARTNKNANPAPRGPKTSRRIPAACTFARHWNPHLWTWVRLYSTVLVSEAGFRQEGVKRTQAQGFWRGEIRSTFEFRAARRDGTRLNSTALGRG